MDRILKLDVHVVCGRRGWLMIDQPVASRTLSVRPVRGMAVEAVIFLLVLILCGITPLHAEEKGVSLIDTLKKVRPDEFDKTTYEISKELTLSQFDKTYRPFVEDMVGAGKYLDEQARKLAEEKYDELGRELADVTEDQLLEQIELRYPDPNSAARKMLSHIKGNPEGYKAVMKSLLNGDRKYAAQAFTKGIKDYGTKKFNDALNRGRELIKNAVNGVVPGSGMLDKLGVNYSNTYVSAATGVADISVRGKAAQDEFILNCLHDRYRNVRKSRGADEARIKILDFGVLNYDCPGTDPDEGWQPIGGDRHVLSGLADTYRGVLGAGKRITSEMGTLTGLGLDRPGIADLLKRFEDGIERGELPRSLTVKGFGPWAQKEIASARPRRPHQGRGHVPSSQEILIGQLGELAAIPFEKAGQILDGTLRPVGEALWPIAVALVKALGPQRYEEVGGNDYLPVNEVKKFTEGRKDEIAEQAAEQAKKEKEDKDPEKIASKVEQDLKCNPKHRTVKSALDKEFTIHAQTADKGPDYVDEEGCRPYGKAAKREEKSAKTVYQYEVPEKSPRDEADAHKVRCAALNSHVDKAVEQFGEGQIKQAGSALNVVMSDLAALPSASACAAVRQRVSKNIPKVNGIIAVLDDIKDGLTTCEPDKLDRQAKILEGAQNIKLRALRNRVKRARTVAVKYTAAKQSFLAGDMARSESLFRQALGHARGKEGLTCENIEGRIGGNIKRIDKLQDFKKATTAALDTCNMTRVSSLMGELKGSTNPYLDKVRDRLIRAQKKCEDDAPLAAGLALKLPMLAGKWKTNHGVATLKQRVDHIEGTILYNNGNSGEFSGSLKPHVSGKYYVLDYNWKNDVDYGNGIMNIPPGNQGTVKGYWVDQAGTRGKWVWTKAR